MQPDASKDELLKLLESLSLADLLAVLEDRIAQKVSERMGYAAPSAATRRLFSVTEAAEYLNRTPEAVRHLIAHKRLVAVRWDRKVSIDRRDLDQLIDQNKY